MRAKKNKANSVKRALATSGSNFLKENPIVLCALPSGDNMDLVLLEGHHRTRYSGKYHIDAIPAIVCTVEQATEIQNRIQSSSDKPPFTPEDFSSSLQTSVLEAMRSFEEAGMPIEKQPKSLEGISSIDQLRDKFTSFE